MQPRRRSNTLVISEVGVTAELLGRQHPGPSFPCLPDASSAAEKRPLSLEGMSPNRTHDPRWLGSGVAELITK
jgi:hypothetical protein